MSGRDKTHVSHLIRNQKGRRNKRTEHQDQWFHSLSHQRSSIPPSRDSHDRFCTQRLKTLKRLSIRPTPEKQHPISLKNLRRPVLTSPPPSPRLERSHPMSSRLPSVRTQQSHASKRCRSPRRPRSSDGRAIAENVVFQVVYRRHRTKKPSINTNNKFNHTLGHHEPFFMVNVFPLFNVPAISVCLSRIQ